MEIVIIITTYKPSLFSAFKPNSKFHQSYIAENTVQFGFRANILEPLNHKEI